MTSGEPAATALVLLVVSALVLACALASRFAARVGVPLVLLFLALGMLAGTDGLGGIPFEDHALSFRIATVALVLILFDGGLNTSVTLLKRYAGPSLLLATIGVIVTAGLVGVAARVAGFPWKQALLLGSIVSSTDAAAVFSVLRSGGVATRERVGATLELESGLNDPMAVILTTVFIDALGTGAMPQASAAGLIVVQLAVGALVGLGVFLVGKRLSVNQRLPTPGLYPIVTLSLAFAAFGLATLGQGSGFLAVYVTAIGIGDLRLPYRAPLLRVHDFLAWSGQVALFVVLGLLASPSRVLEVAPQGLGIAAFLVFVARPLTVFAILLPFRYPVREMAYIAWGGLKGAVPIVLGVMPVLAGVDGASRILDVVLFVVIVSAVLQGSTMRWLADRLRVAKRGRRPLPATVEIVSTRVMTSDLLTFEVDAASAVCGATLADIPFPPRSSAMLVVRGDDLIAPRGDTSLEEGDQVYVFCAREDRPVIQLLFGRAVD